MLYIFLPHIYINTSVFKQCSLNTIKKKNQDFSYTAKYKVDGDFETDI